MENYKLMAPLFHGGNFNREGRKIRAVLEREISDGTQSYRLWRRAGKPNVNYPQAENDKYLLYAEINGYLLPLGITDFRLIHCSGTHDSEKQLYGGKEGRDQYFDHLRESGGDEAVFAALQEEDKVITQYGTDPIHQVQYIRSMLNERVRAYLEAKENGGQTFPDFTGALVMDDLTKCVELSAVYRAKCQMEYAARGARIEAENKAYCEEKNRVAEQAVSAAIQIIREGGTLENQTVEFFRSRYDSSAYSIFNYLMRQYQVDVPIHTVGWINANLCSATIRDGTCRSLQYYRRKSGRGSRKFFEYMNDLIRAVTTHTPERAA